MKTLVMAIAAVFAMCTSAMAQDSENTQREHKKFSQTEMIEAQTNHMVKQLGLDDTQKTALLKLNTEYAGKMHHGMGMPPRGKRAEGNDSVKQERPTEAQMKEMKTNMKAAREQMEETRNAYNAELKNILTDEQYTKYEEMEKKMRERGGMRGGMRGHGGPRMGNRNLNSQDNQATAQPEE